MFKVRLCASCSQEWHVFHYCKSKSDIFYYVPKLFFIIANVMKIATIKQMIPTSLCTCKPCGKCAPLGQSACHPPQGQSSNPNHVNYRTSTEDPHCDIDHSYTFFFSPQSPDQRTNIDRFTNPAKYELACNIIPQWKERSGPGRANVESVPMADFESLHQNQRCQYEPCVLMSGNFLSRAQHLNELHAQRTVVFHMADRPTDTPSLIYSAAAAASSRPRFNRSHLLMSDGPRIVLPSPPACPVWWSRHCLSQFIWLQMSLITYLNCIMAKISSEIKPHSVLSLVKFLHAEFCNAGQTVWQNSCDRLLTKEILFSV